uniref:SwnR n=1 Tax=Alternaria oxytropis TaxID=570715 RepID=A0A2Z2F1Y2_9PLEO|nr:SwnR [Alternaria oxytropis]WAX05054.1 putative NADB Rossmann-fold reductase [Alternaria oxytropis]
MRVAIAGYGDLTHYICEEFIKVGYELVILTRNPKVRVKEEGIVQAITDYTLASLKAPLSECQALISTISDTSPAYTDVHRNLIRACHDSQNCKRFIPAEFAANIKTYPDQPGFYFATHEPIREMLRTQTDLEWTLVCIGWLADYFVPAKNRYIKDIGEFHPINWAGNRIVVPGTGDEPVDFTWARDVARGLSALLKAPSGSWEPYTFMSGDRSCWNTMVELSKKINHMDIPIEHRSLHSIVEMIKKTKDNDTLVLADYYLLSISQACANPPELTEAHRRKYFQSINFRTLRDGFSQYDQYPNSII